MERVIITRKVDELGRIVIPKEMREELKIEKGQKLCICQVKIEPYFN